MHDYHFSTQENYVLYCRNKKWDTTFREKL